MPVRMLVINKPQTKVKRVGGGASGKWSRFVGTLCAFAFCAFALNIPHQIGHDDGQ